MLCCLADMNAAVPCETAKDSEWRPARCDKVDLGIEDSAEFKDKRDNSAYDVDEPADEATDIWAENVASSERETGASGWVGNSFKNIGVDGTEWNGTDDLFTTNSLLHTDRRSHWFTASVVINTGNKDRCEFVLN